MIVVVDLFRKIADAVSHEVGHLNYMHGHPKEITDLLTQMTRSPQQSAGKYPLLALFQDFEEDKGGEFTFVRLNLIIATLTDRKLTAEERYNVSFRPVLYPIYDELILAIGNSGFFHECSPFQIEHTKIDRLYWGRNGLYGNQGNVFNDYIDCIELKNLKLNIKTKC